MKILNFLFTKKPFTVEDYQLRVVSAWFSDNYVQFEYSINGGKKWIPIYHCEKPFLGSIDYNYTWEILVYPLGDGGDFSKKKEAFNTYQKVLDFEKNERKTFEEGNADLLKKRQAIIDRKKEALRRANG